MISIDRLAAGGHPVAGRLHQGPHLHGVEARLDHAEAHAAGARASGWPPARPGPRRRGAAPRRRARPWPPSPPARGSRAGTRAAAGRAGGRSPAARPSPRGSRRSPPAGPGAAPRARPASSSGLSARIIRRTTGSRSSPRNMCSVRHSPIPSAPSRRALAASSPLSALARTPRWPARISSAHDEHRVELRRRVGRGEGDLAEPRPCRSVPSIESHSPSATVTSPTVIVAVRDPQGLGPDHGRLAPAPGHHGGVAHQPAPGGQDALGGQHAVDVLGRGLGADQDHLLAPAGGGRRVVGGEVGPAHRRPGRGRRAPWRAPGGRVPANCGCSTAARWSSVIRSTASARVSRIGRLRGHVDGHLAGRRGRCACPPGSGASRACPARW